MFVAATSFKPLRFHKLTKSTSTHFTETKKCPADCHCDTDDCKNVQRHIACPPSCKNCANQHFRKSDHHAKTETRDCGPKGTGLFTLEPIKTEQFVMPFTAEVITEVEKKVRQVKYARKNQHAYLFGTGQYTLDATKYGNNAKFVNHSCNPNMIVVRWTINKAPSNFKALVFVASRDIEKGEELTINYGEDYSTDMKCHCGAKCCAGIVGKKPIVTKEQKPFKDTTPELPKSRKRPAKESAPQINQRPKRTRNG